ncbi:vWA domain-containing protein [Nonomuraea angiospora]|uniref:vWA domain-containing protein n=1 Tax=Nonomuraea angiospora TaxID=46172 RepID=UPI0029AF2E0A|nr:VWA domain-containing protein [Nonomuraea angiospora]MDX3109263.1 VWA domain-containing protein [Nonomuraea angiospora]
MTEQSLLVRIGDHVHGFLRDLRDRGLPVPVPRQRVFLQAIEAVGPRDVTHLYWIGVATLTTSHEDLAVYSPTFERWFGEVAARRVPDEEFSDEEATAPRGKGDEAPLTATFGGEAGLKAGSSERERRPMFGPASEDDRAVLSLLRRELPGAVPTIRSRRRRPARRGPWIDVARICRESRRSHGEIVTLRRRNRPRRQRRVLLLIDVSGSMKQHSADYLRFAHAVVGRLDRVEVFTFGTRLTRVTEPLRARHVDAAVGSLSDVVLDAEGGTRIGASLQEFLANARHVTVARGALTIVLSDGLERGDCRPMQAAVRRLSLLSHRLLWWSPLACDPAYRPVTRGMSAVLGSVDALAGVRDLRTAYEQVQTLIRE